MKSGDRVIARDRVIGTSQEQRGVEIGEIRLHDQVQSFGVRITRSPDHRITRSAKRLAQFWVVFLSALREIFDEAAYERFLSRTDAARSVSSYRDFLREREAALARKPRCC
jgi:hypothetical protein